MKDTSRLLRVGTVPFLNARPLTWTLESRPEVTLASEVPSRLIARLRDGDFDLALVSSIELFRSEGYTIVPAMGVGSDGPVKSVRLFRNAPLRDGCVVSLDSSSRSSQCLTRVACEKLLGLSRIEYRDDPPHVHPGEIEADAVLRIGDPALRLLGENLDSMDLGELWRNEVGLPFVYAVWMVAPGIELGDRQSVFEDALEAGLRARPRIAREAAQELRIPQSLAEEYLSEAIQYRLGESHWSGLATFRDLAASLGLARGDLDLRFTSTDTGAHTL